MAASVLEHGRALTNYISIAVMLLLCSACAPTTTAPTSPASHNGYVLIVEAMDGAIWVESSGVAGEGSCFYFTLPAAAGVAESREPA